MWVVIGKSDRYFNTETGEPLWYVTTKMRYAETQMFALSREQAAGMARSAIEFGDSLRNLERWRKLEL